jgi:histidinol-phosphatase (PHP family)
MLWEEVLGASDRVIVRGSHLLKIIADMHVHSVHSIDGRDSMHEMCAAAIERGIRHLCFTEHYDANPNSDSYGRFSVDEFERDIDDCRERFEDSLEVLKGIEFGEPHRYQAEFVDACQAGFDVILGSVHWIGDKPIAEWIGTHVLSANEVFALYYEEILAAVEFGGFDVLAHFNLPERYIMSTSDFPALTEIIFAKMIKHDIALEVNTSTYTATAGKCPANLRLVHHWRSMGGSKVVVGSDAHRCRSIGQEFERAEHLLSEAQLSYGLFRNRRYHSLG